ncbi:MAG TPA: bifunctional 5,10-methylenetetrahydrofolate dehydrogenase/5,10-methenyltetrahydrofolate cyclohydrolase [Chloroflexota bacterium]|nr:bifunctional 5,10-methylenetetrahydrofolate dehydrogenase/5,10-methenyltetrahydrofolate cyclohydrolase [Chloroflexota bacterium]
MAAIVVDGNALAREVRSEAGSLLSRLASRGLRSPSLAIVQIGDDAGASLYTRRLQRSFADTGVRVEVRQLAASASQGEALACIAELSRDQAIDAIQVQTPVPAHIGFSALADALDPAKDVDGVHPINAGLLAQGRPAIVPATPLGGFEILTRHGIAISGARAVVVGRSPTVGRPMALLLLQHDATVTVCHTRTKSLGSIVAEAEILAVAAGRPRLIAAEMVRPGSAVIDFGVSVVDGKAVGDVDPAAADRAGLYTPVPGGTGPMTTAILLRNAITLYCRAHGVAEP